MIRKAAPILLFLLLVLVPVACATPPTAAPEATAVQATPLATDTAVPATATRSPTLTPLPPTEPPPTDPATTATITVVPTETVVAARPAEEIAEEIDAFLTTQVEADRFSGAVLVARGEELILSRGYGLADRENDVPVTSDTRFRIGSLTKAFTAMAIMQLQERGLVDVDDSVCDYVSDCPADWQTITIHQLLTHTSGIPGNPPFAAVAAATPIAPEQNIAWVAELPLDFSPGTGWGYSNSGYILLGLIIESVTGETYESYLHANILDPLGMADTGYDHNRGDLAVGYVNRFQKAGYLDMTQVSAAGALYSTVNDLYKWTQAYDTESLASRPTLELMQMPHADDGSGEYAAGYGWFIGEMHDRPVVDHGGAINGFTSDIAMFPQEDLDVIVLSNREDVATWFYVRLLAKMALGIE